MKILCRARLPEGSADHGVEVIEGVGCLDLKLADDVHHLDLTPGYWAFFKTQSGAVAKVDGTWLVMQRDGPVVLRSAFHVEDMKRDSLATAWVTPKDAAVIVAGQVASGAQQVDGNLHNLEILGQMFPEAAALFKKWKARQKLLFSITPTDSLAALEKQVDFLTSLLVQLHPELRSQLQGFIDATSLAPGQVDKAVEFKAGLREIQAEYNEMKS